MYLGQSPQPFNQSRKNNSKKTNLEKSGAVANVSFGDLIGPADDGGATGSGHAKVVGLPQPADDGDVVLQQEVLRKVGHALLGDHLDGGKRVT
jgi:hypothetical protein